MVSIVREKDEGDPQLALEMMRPGQRLGFSPQVSSDVQVYRNKDRAAADARDAARANPYGRSALRVNVDAVVGKAFTLVLLPQAEALGVSEDEADDWANRVMQIWEASANSPRCHFDAARKQTFTGLMRTGYQEFYQGGEALGVFKWKESTNGQRTCLLQIPAERLCDPDGTHDKNAMRRMGVQRDADGAPEGFWIRSKHPSDEWLWGYGGERVTWDYVPRFTPFGRWNVAHFFEHDRCDMTRGLSSFATALLPMRLLHEYNLNELETAGLRATYAAVVESELDYEDAMKVIGEPHRNAIQSNPVLDITLQMMADKAQFYRGQEFKFGKSKIAHLLPNEKLHMVQGNNGQSVMADYVEHNTNVLASALGVAKESLTKDYSQTNYSGARAALYDVWRSYEVQRELFIRGYAWPIVENWLEEMIALRGVIPMLGSRSFYDVRDDLCFGTFDSWDKPRLDPVKEGEADLQQYRIGGKSLREMMGTDGARNLRTILRERQKEKLLLEELGLKPEDIDWSLRADAVKAEAAKTAAENRTYPSDPSNKSK